jgi:hypothetical protein
MESPPVGAGRHATLEIMLAHRSRSAGLVYLVVLTRGQSEKEEGSVIL